MGKKVSKFLQTTGNRLTGGDGSNGRTTSSSSGTGTETVSVTDETGDGSESVGVLGVAESKKKNQTALAGTLVGTGAETFGTTSTLG